ncbi:hypothetical protein [Phreatobacter sp. AB_2022a]|uniref:hypothetical protein n=1 Tax=Phreatobacter sp. AB_2022a TaxID=3003134 RepID=UPI002286D854|nr:hypothetical protein [Phreatobacter sp. AB_2022a]MCZ0737653.1 hypothetical protein [Phreatobacter sp. AB_2022a]
MPHFRKIGWDQVGFDADRSLQLIPVGRQATLYLVAGPGLDVQVDDDTVVKLNAGTKDDRQAHGAGGLSAWEKDQTIRKIVLTASSKPDATTTLRALLDGRDFAKPVEIQTIMNSNWCQAGAKTAAVTPALMAELKRMPLRDAVIRIAEDQMNSAIAKQGDGFGVYDIDKSYNWCGAFAYWCWAHAAAVQGEFNPFGPSNNVLFSPQKAIHWAMKPESAGQLLRYSGTSPMDGKGHQDYREIGWNGCSLERGDIVLLRKAHAGDWKHVCLVDTVEGDALTTMDGNQGKYNAIKRTRRSLSAMTADGKAPALVFVHAMI